LKRTTCLLHPDKRERAQELQRGCLSVETTSAHSIADAGFRKAVVDFFSRVRSAMTDEMAAIGELSPYRSA